MQAGGIFFGRLRRGAPGAPAIIFLIAACGAAPARADPAHAAQAGADPADTAPAPDAAGAGRPRYELYLSPSLDAETGARLMASAAAGLGEGETRLFRPLGAGGAAKVARGFRLWLWDAPIAWWLGVVEHEGFGHGGRGREFDTSPGVHLGSPWGGRDSYATFDLTGTSADERLLIYAGGVEANGLAATLLERRAVEGVPLRPIELMHLVANRLVASDYMLRTTPDPRREPARFFSEYQGGGDAANYLGLLHEAHESGSGITPAGVDGSIARQYRRLIRQAWFNLADPGIWWGLASAIRLTARGDDAPPVPLPRAGSYRFLPVLSAEWTPSGGETSLEWVMAPHAPGPAPRLLSFVARRGSGPAGRFGALGATSEDLLRLGPVSLGGAAEVWNDPPGGTGGGVRARFRLTRGRLRGLYFDLGGKSQGYWVGQPARPGVFAAVGLVNLP